MFSRGLPGTDSGVLYLRLSFLAVEGIPPLWKLHELACQSSL